MGALSAKLRSSLDGGILFWCPGCDGAHQVMVGAGAGPRWGYNGDPDRPTFTPSILVRGVERLTDDEHRRVMAGEKIDPRPSVCHSFVTDGRIRFLGDCTHDLAGQTVDLPHFDEEGE